MRRPGSRGRLTTPLLVLATATLLTVGLLIGRELTSALGKSAGPTIPRVYLAFVLCWTGLTVNVGLCYLLFGRLRLNASLWWTAAISASWIAGSALGFLLISSWSINVAAPFAGSRTLGTAALVAVWLYFSHVALLTGYASAIRLSQDRHREGLPITGTGTAIDEPGVGRETIQAGSVRARGAFRSAAVGRTRR
jgi:membrane protein